MVLIYVLGAQALLQTPQAEEGHNLFMSVFTPLIQGITGRPQIDVTGARGPGVGGGVNDARDVRVPDARNEPRIDRE